MFAFKSFHLQSIGNHHFNIWWKKTTSSQADLEFSIISRDLNSSVSDRN